MIMRCIGSCAFLALVLRASPCFASSTNENDAAQVAADASYHGLGTKRFYVNQQTRTCVRDCEKGSSIDGHSGVCGGVVTEAWVQLYHSIGECCREKLSWIDVDICEEDSKPNNNGTFKFYADHKDGFCRQDCDPGYSPGCQRMLPPAVLHETISSCCSQSLAWVDAKYCNSRSIGRYSDGWVIDWRNERCIKDDNHNDPTEKIYDTADECCGRFSWLDINRCISASYGSAYYSNKWYTDWSTMTCKKDCNFALGAPCSGSPTDTSVTFYDTADLCCSVSLSWLARGVCTSGDPQVPVDPDYPPPVSDSHCSTSNGLLFECMSDFLSSHGSDLYIIDSSFPAFQNNTMINNLYAREMFTPAVVAIPSNLEEIQVAVKASQVCRATAFTVISGGHNAAGYNLNTGGVVLNLEYMKKLVIDKESLTMTAQAGVRWGDVYPILNNTGIGVTGGGCSHVGIPGFTLGGGWSWISRSYGLASDNLINATVVLSNGTSLIVNKETATGNADMKDLWFSLRGGGGGNFGIVVELQMKLHQTKQPVINGTGTGLAGEMCWSLTRSRKNATEAMRTYKEWMKTMPDEMTGAVIMTTWALPTIEYLRSQGYLSHNSAAAISSFIRNNPLSNESNEKAFCITHIYNGPYEEGRRLVQPMLELYPDLAEVNNRTLSDMDLPGFELEIGASAATAQPGYFYTNSRFFREGAYDDYLIEELINGMLVSPGAKDTIVFHVGGGAIARVNENDSAFGHRDAFILVQCKGIWDTMEDGSKHIKWTDQLIQSISKNSSGSYVNYMNPYVPDWEEKYYGEINSKRLQRTKNIFDPYNFFNFPSGFVASAQETTVCPGGWEVLPSSSRPDMKQVVRCACGPNACSPASRGGFCLGNAAKPGEVFPIVGLGTGGEAPHIPGEPTPPTPPKCWRDDCPDGGRLVEDAIYNWLVFATDDTVGRRVDDAIIYGHPIATGRAINRAITSGGLTRGQIYYTSKVGGLRAMGYEDTLAQADEILKKTGLKYIDMLLVHYPKSSAPSSELACRVGSHTYDEKECRLSTWRAMIELFTGGVARAIGVSNYEGHHIAEIVSAKMQLPSVNQVAYNPHRHRSHAALKQECAALGISLIGYSPFWGGSRLPPAVSYYSLLENPVVTSIGKSHGYSSAQVLLVWSFTLGVAVNPRTDNVNFMKENVAAAHGFLSSSFVLDVTEMSQLSRLKEATCDLDPFDYRCAPTFDTCPPTTCKTQPCAADIEGACNTVCISTNGACYEN